MAYCPKCRAEVGETVNFCRKCGYDLKTVEPEQTKPEARGIPVCSEHPERDAVGSCSVCGKYICSMCRTILDKNLYCPSCVERIIQRDTKPRKSTNSFVSVERRVEGQLENRSEFRVEPVVMFICGIITLVGVFLPWAGGDYETISGWSMMDMNGIQDFPFPFFVIVGSIISIICPLAIFILALVGSENIRRLKQLEIIATIAVTITLIVALNLLIQAASIATARYGLYIITITAILGFIAGLVKSLSHA